MSDKARERFHIMRSGEERARNRQARAAYRERQRKHAWQDATRILAELFDNDPQTRIR